MNHLLLPHQNANTFLYLHNYIIIICQHGKSTALTFRERKAKSKDEVIFCWTLIRGTKVGGAPKIRAFLGPKTAL